MKKLFIFLFLVVTSCETIYDLEEHKGTIIKYKYVDIKGGWVELGMKEGKKKYLIYLPLEYDSLYQVGDTLK